MLFQSWTFALFFLVVYPLYLALYKTRFRLPWLLAASYLFYASFNPLYVLILLYSTVVDYFALSRLVRSPRARAWLTLSIANNLALLAVFKYGAFLTDNVNALLALLGSPYTVPRPGILLPVGLSFYVFQSIGYCLDVYRGRVPRETSFFAHATFVAYFPRLLAGPIERAENLLPQLHETPPIRAADAAEGLSLFATGLFKKMALADYFALYVNRIYAAPEQASASALVLATFLFAWQIYFDFSGYTDMARGLARMMGIRLMENFNHPYLTTGLGEFWQRWHISLSSWFRDYVYIPLGGNRRGTWNTYRNMILTMVLSGLWHGAAWTFVLWGGVHALGRCATRRLETTHFYQNRLPRPVKQICVFLFVGFAWIFFRAATNQDAWLIVTRIASAGWSDPRCPLLALAFSGAAWLWQFVVESRLCLLLRPAPVRIALFVMMIVYLAIFAPTSEQPFYYLQF